MPRYISKYVPIDFAIKRIAEHHFGGDEAAAWADVQRAIDEGAITTASGNSEKDMLSYIVSGVVKSRTQRDSPERNEPPARTWFRQQPEKIYGPIFTEDDGPTTPDEQDDPRQPDGEQGQPSRRKQGRQRARNMETEALLINNLNTVISKAKRKWPDPQTYPGINQMAEMLVVGEPNKKVGGYSEEAIRKILSGTYKPAKDRGIPGLGSG